MCIQRLIYGTHTCNWMVIKHMTCTKKDCIFEHKHKSKLTFGPFKKSKIKTQVISIDNVLSNSALLILIKPH